jgi:hypothetical protein
MNSESNLESLIAKLPKINTHDEEVVELISTTSSSTLLDTFKDNTTIDIDNYFCIKIIKKYSGDKANETIYYDIKENNDNETIKNFKNVVNNNSIKFLLPILYKHFLNNLRSNSIDKNFEIDIYFLKFAKSSIEGGGKKGGVKYTVKQLQAIASKNNIKITKKVDGKTVRLNKKGLMTKLKRYKLI